MYEEGEDEGEELETPNEQGVGYTIEDFEAAAAADDSKDVNPDELKLEGNSVPEKFRGKSLSEILQDNARLEQEARIAAIERNSRRPVEAAPAPAPVQSAPEEVELTREQIKEMYDEDPIAAIEAMQAQALRNAEKHLSVRLGSLEAGTIGATENWAREQYKDEFELFGDKIEEFRKSIPNKTILTTKQGWKDMISYIRGQDDNLDKLIEHRAGNSRPSPSRARSSQDSSSGFNGTSSRRSSLPKNGTRLSADQKEAAKGLGMSEAEYAKWANVR
jgi:hypothetical protein